jgi:hypothetical protein
LTNSVGITAKNVLGVTTATNSLSLKLTTNGLSAGVISGGFAYPGTGTKTNTAISGIVLQQQNEAVGYFLRTNQSGSLLLQNSAGPELPDVSP